MGWVCNTFFPQYKAHVQSVIDGNGLDIQFSRLFTDARDEMSDCIRPDWMPLDEFLIEFTGWHEREEMATVNGFTFKRTVCENRKEFRIHVKTRYAANKIWLLGKNGCSYDDFVRMHDEGLLCDLDFCEEA